MADLQSKLIITGEDKTAAAFRSASRNAQNLARETDRLTRSLTPGMRQATQAVDVFGLSLGKLATVTGAAEFTRRAVMGFAELEDKITRAGFSANITEGQTKALGVALAKMSKEVNYPIDKLIGGFNSLQRKTDQTVEQSLVDDTEGVFPVRYLEIGGVVAGDLQEHAGAGMAGIGLLHGIHRECANGVYAKLIESASLVGSPARGFRGSDRFQSGFGWHWEASRDLQTDPQSIRCMEKGPWCSTRRRPDRSRLMIDNSALSVQQLVT